jgi:hypothetical protein
VDDIILSLTDINTSFRRKKNAAERKIKCSFNAKPLRFSYQADQRLVK